MNCALVKIDVAAHITRKPVRVLFEMADGASLLDTALIWVFDLSNDLESQNSRGGAHRRELRFWEPELQARASADVSKHRKYCGWELDWVIAKILPEKRMTFHAGEVDQLFQIRPRTRIDFAELNGDMKAGRNFYPRADLAEFLKRRWIAGKNNLTPRATARLADTNKAEPILHAGNSL